MRGSTLVDCSKAAALAVLVATGGHWAAWAQDAAVADFDFSDRRAAFSRQDATATAGRMRQIGLVNGRLERTRRLRLSGRNAHASDLAIRFKGATAERSAALNTKKYTAAEKDRRTRRVAVWFGGNLIVDSTRRQVGRASRFYTNGLVVGADARLGPRLVVGNVLGAGFDKTAFGRAGSLSSRYVSDTLYGSFFTSANSYIDLALGAAAMDYSTAYDDLGDTSTGGRNGTQVFASTRYSHDFQHGQLSIRPYGQVVLSRSSFDPYTDHGAYTVVHRAQSVYQTTFKTGLVGSRTFKSRLGRFRPHATVEVEWNRKQTSGGLMQLEEGPSGEPFSMAATDSGGGRFRLDAGVDWTLGKRANASASYKLSAGFADATPKQTIGARLQMKF